MVWNQRIEFSNECVHICDMCCLYHHFLNLFPFLCIGIELVELVFYTAFFLPYDIHVLKVSIITPQSPIHQDSLFPQL